MKRQLKFRAWDGLNMLYPNDTQKGMGSRAFILLMDMDGNCSWNNPYGFAPEEVANVYIMQSSGLFDKNNTEIYEGDILKLVTSHGKEITVTCEFGSKERELRNFMGQVNTCQITGFYFLVMKRYPTYPIVENHLGKNDLEIMEVVGNIFETPELLKEQ